jgi:CNT family concentrative nucleoside transporter
MVYHLLSFAGFIAFAAIAWLVSSNRRNPPWRTVIWGMALQLAIGLIIFRVPFSQRPFLWLNDAALALLSATERGTEFLFGPLAASPGEPGSVGFILLFQVLPVAIFFSAFTAVLYYLRVLPVIVRLFATVFHRTLRTSGAESLCGAANIFVGIESALTVKPYIERMTRSELLTVLTTGMATVASSTLGIYVAFLSELFPRIAGHLISASVMSIPAAIVTTKLMLPETGEPETRTGVPPEDQSGRPRTLMGAIVDGSMDGLKLAAGISALLIAMLGLASLVDKILGGVSGWLGMSEPLSLVRILSWVFYPVALLLGLPPSDIQPAAALLGERAILTEVVSYQHLAGLISEGRLTGGRSVVILSYALCGFAHIASMAIFVGGTAALAPSRREDLAGLAWRAFLAATLATLMTGAVAGIFSTGEGVLLLK